MLKWYILAVLTLLIHGYVIGRTNGRISRKLYLIINITIPCFIALLFIPIWVNKYSNIAVASRVSVFLTLPFAAYWFFKAKVLRLHDLDISGWYSLLFYVPIAGQVLTFLLFFWKGSEELNKYDQNIDFQALVPESGINISQENRHQIVIRNVQFFKRDSGFRVSSRDLQSLTPLSVSNQSNTVNSYVYVEIEKNDLLGHFKPYLLIRDGRKIVIGEIEYFCQKIDLKYILTTTDSGIYQIERILESEGYRLKFHLDRVFLSRKEFRLFLGSVVE